LPFTGIHGKLPHVSLSVNNRMSKDQIRDKIFVEIKAAKQPIDCEKIARATSVGWGTALRYALELVMEGQVNGLKTSKSWVFWIGDLPAINNQIKEIVRELHD